MHLVDGDGLAKDAKETLEMAVDVTDDVARRSDVDETLLHNELAGGISHDVAQLGPRELERRSSWRNFKCWIHHLDDALVTEILESSVAL